MSFSFKPDVPLSGPGFGAGHASAAEEQKSHASLAKKLQGFANVIAVDWTGVKVQEFLKKHG